MKKAIIFLSVAAAIVLTVLACSKVNEAEFRELAYDEWEVGDNGLIYKTGERLFDPKSNKTLVNDIDWLQYETYDSIGVLAKKGKRAFINLNTGKLLTSLSYDHGWFFRSNRGVMERNDSLFIFDRSGKVLNKVGIPARGNNLYEYLFNDGKMVVEAEPNKYGILDTAARWIMEPIYDHLEHNWDNQLYSCKLGDTWSVLNYDLDTIMCGKWKNLDISWNSGIIVTETNGIERSYSYEGKLLFNVIYESIDQLYYDDEPTGLFRYTAHSGKCGLMDSNYKPLTPPQFYEIEARSKSVFFGYYGDFGVLLNRKGQTII